MRHPRRIGLAVILSLVAIGGLYTAYWWVVAAKIKDGVVAWRQSEGAGKIDASWRGLRVTGFPLEFRVEIKDAILRDRAWIPAPEMRAAALTGSAKPWSLFTWRLLAPQGISGEVPAAGGRAAVRLAARSGEGAVWTGFPGETRLWTKLQDITAQADDKIPIETADVWLTLPPRPAMTDADPSIAVAIDARRILVPAPPPSFGHIVDRLAIGVTVKGPVGDGAPAQVAAAWRDAGGTIDVDRFDLQWGGLGVNATGTLALDRQLQPIGAFSAGIAGFATLLRGLVAVDWLTPEQASLVEIALNTLARPGPDGRPQIAAPFTMQNGKIYLGPARLGAAPHISWE